MIFLVKLNQLFVTTNNAKLQHKIGIQNKMYTQSKTKY